MKKLVIFFTTILFSGVLFAQKPYDPLTDPMVQKPEDRLSFIAGMIKNKEAILKQSDIGKEATGLLKADFLKKKEYESVFQFVVVKSSTGNEEELNKNYELSKQLYYQVVWSKAAYARYPNEDARVGFYYFKTCYDLGRLLSKTGDYKNSYEFYKTAVDYYKTDSSLYFAAMAGIMGIANKTIPKPDSGFYNILRTINGAIELKPKSAEYISTRGKYYWDILNDTAKAFADFSKAVQLNPKDATVNECLAIINFYKANYKEAINNITKCIETGRHVASDYSKRAIFYSALQNYTAALPDFDEAIFWDETNANYYTLRGECNVNLKNYTAAYDDYGFATMLNPNDADSKKELQKLDPLLKAEYEKMGFTPQNAYQFFLNRADKMAKISEGFKLGPAVMNYYKCIQVEPKNPVPYNKAGKLFRAMKMNAYAEQFLRYAAYADGKNPEYFCDLGDYYFEYVDKPQMASGCYDTAALLGSKNAFGYYTNGLIKHTALKNYNGALKDYTAALVLDPAYKDALQMRGHLYYKELKNYTAALTDYEALGKLNPQNEDYKEFIKAAKEKLKEQ